MGKVAKAPRQAGKAKKQSAKSSTGKADKEKTQEYIGHMRQMLQIRAFEDKVFELLSRDLLVGASHVYAGEEAIAVGACAAIGPDDYITSTHRGHGHCLARGGEIKRMLAELCGKATGYSKGKGGSMHIADVEAGNLGATGIVGGNLPVATGAGLACKFNKRNQVVLCFFGDGASNNGTFHESLNMAGAWKLPVVYICENNLYGMSVPLKKASVVQDISTRAAGYGMPGVIVDGMKVLEVKETVEEAIERARRGEGPTLIEAKAYRYRGHSRSDPRKYRTKEEEKFWQERCPIKQFLDFLKAEDHLTQDEFSQLDIAVQMELAEAEDFALNQSPYPDISELHEDIYKGWVNGKLCLEKSE